MNQDDTYEKELDLRDMTCYVLKKWKIVLLFLLLGMLILGGGMGVKTWKNNEETTEADIEEGLQSTMAKEAMIGLANPEDLEGDALLYYNQLVKIETLTDSLNSKKAALASYKEIQTDTQNKLDQLETNIEEIEDPEELADSRQRQNTLEANLYSYTEKIGDAQNSIASIEEDISTAKTNAGILLERLNEEEEVFYEEESLVKEGVKYGLIGAVLGTMAAVFGICILYVLSDKVQDPETLKKAMGLEVLAVVPFLNAKKGRGTRSFRFNRYYRQTPKQSCEVLHARLINICGSLDGKRLMITGTAKQEYMEDIQVWLQKKEPGAKFQLYRNPLKYPETILAFSQADEIILVEVMEQSVMEDLYQEKMMMEDVKKKPAGIVVIA